ncbi:MAG TPA: hypothetical protein VL651_03860 [Bacteroidia bacterium]|jgi:hypothetical protein|nr:hypothetical protein [Bacteroidia bacterium]
MAMALVKKILKFLSRNCIFILMLFSVWLMANLHGGRSTFRNVIISDGKGYYGYLPAVFIYHDLNFQFFDTIENKYYEGGTKYDYRSFANGKHIDKYFCGEAVLQSPFFIMGMIATKFSDQPYDGYSRYLVLCFLLGALFYLWLGLKHLKIFLRMHGASEERSAFILAVIFFGTNLMYYATVEPAMSHLYSFAMISIFLVYGKRWIDNADRRSFLILAATLGIIIAIRPVNAIIVFWLFVEAKGFIPLFRKKLNALKDPVQFVGGILLFLIPVSIQFIIYRMQCGSFFVNSYLQERFHFDQPHIFDFLFSYRKGLFLYLPVTLIALFGLIPMWKVNRFRAITTFLFLFLLIYVLSSWWMWYYGGSFGTRVIVEFLPVFALLLYFLLNGIKKKIVRISVVALLILLSLFCQFQALQYRYGMIHWSDMDKEKYWKVFFDTDLRRLY